MGLFDVRQGSVHSRKLLECFNRKPDGNLRRGSSSNWTSLDVDVHATRSWTRRTSSWKSHQTRRPGRKFILGKGESTMDFTRDDIARQCPKFGK